MASGSARIAAAMLTLAGSCLLAACDSASSDPEGDPSNPPPATTDGTGAADGSGTTANGGSTGQTPGQTPPPRDEPIVREPEIAEVQMSQAERDACKVFVGDAFPDVELPNLSGESTPLTSLFGQRLTVVCFWNMTGFEGRQAILDLGPDVLQPYGNQGVGVVAIAVNETADSVREELDLAEAAFANLLDADGQAFAKVGTEYLPRVYLLDGQGKILWFDIAYKRSTRRDLVNAIQSVVGKSGEAAADSPPAAEPAADDATESSAE